MSKDPKIVKSRKSQKNTLISLNVCVNYKLQKSKKIKIQRTKKTLFISFHVFFCHTCMFHNNYCLLSHYITCLPFNRWLDSNYLFAKLEIIFIHLFLSWSTSHHQKISKKILILWAGSHEHPVNVVYVVCVSHIHTVCTHYHQLAAVLLLLLYLCTVLQWSL